MKNLRILAIYGFVSGVLLLSACLTVTETPSGAELLLDAAAQTAGASCEACSQATLAAAMTQQQINADNQAAAAAEVVRANAQAP